MGRTCPTERCTAFSSESYAAIGIGLSKPEIWTVWNKRWWNDDWCCDVGMAVRISHADPKDDKGNWRAGFDMVRSR